MRQRIARERLAPQTGTRRQHVAPELRHAFVHPQQAVAHRHVVIRRPQVGRALELAVPGVHQLVRQPVALVAAAVPIGEISGADAVLTRLQVLEADVAEVVADREQEVVVGKARRPEYCLGFAQQLAVCRQLRRADLQQ
jgi:hypothetical protein